MSRRILGRLFPNSFGKKAPQPYELEAFPALIYSEMKSSFKFYFQDTYNMSCIKKCQPFLDLVF